MKTKTLTQRFWLAGHRRRSAFLALLALPLLLAACTTSGDSASPFAFPADDGLVLQARIYGSGTPAVILVHDYKSDLGTWSGFAERLTAKGFLVLTYNMRGHSSSPGKMDVSQTNADLTAAVRSMRRNSRPFMFIIGEGLGGIAAINVGALEEMLGVISISAPTSFRGISGINAVPRVESPKLFIAGQEDEQGADAAELYQQRALEPKALALFPGDKKGAALVESNSALRNRIFAFLDANKDAGDVQ